MKKKIDCEENDKARFKQKFLIFQILAQEKKCYSHI